ncbi:MAG TPA: LysR substrate-binding domain-containing protein [Phycisphaerae bacterium]|nr:LysR substrate-binding domain-containing protein [Phycisphaerae bacterium]
MAMTDLPSIPDLQAFLAAARTLHFTRAAESLHIAQPTLSLAIRRLEKSLGIPLFDRVGRSVRLTTAGEAFRTHAAAALATLTRARLAVSDLTSLHAGSLRVGVTHILAASLLPQTLAAFHKKYPRVALHAELLTSANVQRRLLEDSPSHPPLDLGITFSPPTAPELLAQQLFTETVILALRPRHPLARKKSLPFRHLANLPLALTTHDFATRRLLESTAAARKMPLHIAMEFNDIPLLLATAPRAGLPILIARRAIVPHNPRLTLLPITHPTLTHTAHLLWHRDRHRTTAARTFTEMLEQSLTHR